MLKDKNTCYDGIVTKQSSQLELTPEQQKALMDAMATVTEVMAGIIDGVTKAMMPIIEAYNRLPQPLKEALAHGDDI